MNDVIRRYYLLFVDADDNILGETLASICPHAGDYVLLQPNKQRYKVMYVDIDFVGERVKVSVDIVK